MLAVCLTVTAPVRGEGSADHSAQLPLEQVNLEVTSPGRVIKVAEGDSLQAALDAAKPGDAIELEAGGVFKGPFVLPAKSSARSHEKGAEAARWITVRPGTGSTPLPKAGTRVSPDDTTAMARLVASRGAVLSTAPGASHYRLIGLEFRPGRKWLRPGAGAFLNGLVWLHGQDGTMEDMPHHLIIERCVFSGDPVVGTRRGLVLNSAHTAVVDSHFSDFKMRGEDSQAIVGWEGNGPFLIRNNYLEGSAENLMFGGADPSVTDLVPADIEIVGNHFAKPTTWWKGDPGFQGTAWSVKNLLQLKNAKRVLLEGNLFEYSWPESQSGFAIQFTVRNQKGTAPWSVVEDITFRNNVIRHVGRGFNISGYDSNQPSRQTRRIVISNNLFEDVGGRWGLGDLFQVLDGVADVVIEHNTGHHTGKILIGEGREIRGLRLIGNIVRHNQYGIKGTDVASGNATLGHYFPGAVVQGNLFIGGPEQSYPPGNAFPEAPPAHTGRGPVGDPGAVKEAGRAAGVDLATLCAALSPTERDRVCGESAEAPAP